MVVALVLGSVACGETSVDALAIWIDGRVDADGNRQLQIYDRGERQTIEFQPTTPGSETELLQMAVDGRGRGLVTSGTRETVYVDLREGRRGRISDELDMTRDLHPDFAMLRGGDGIVRELLSRSASLSRRLGFMALTTRHGLVPTVIDSPGEPQPGARWEFLSALDAPMMFWVETRGNPSAAAGRVAAVAYPSVFSPLLDVAVPTVVATGTLSGRGIDDNNGGGRIGDGICPHRICVSPSGRVLTTMADEPCTVWQWDWTEAVSPNVPVAPEKISLPEACPEETNPNLVATLGDDLIVMDDDNRLLLFDLSAQTMRAAPKLGEGGAQVVRLTGRGTVLLWITFDGQVVRMDPSGVRLLSTERSFCSVVDGLATSPSGNWVAMSCNGQSLLDEGPSGLIMRVSALGLEQYPGINMRPIAVDDDGNTLLYSFDADDSDAAPRGLFVLGGDGTLARVDDLEPGPATIAVPSERFGRINGRFFDATAIPR